MKRVWVALVSLLIVGGAGFIGWQSRQDKPNNPSTNQNQPNNSDPSEGGKYLVIKEWGLRIKLTGDIKDAEYEISESGSPVFTTKDAEKIKGCEQSSLMAIERAKKGGTIGGAGTTVESFLESDSNPLIKIDEYYYLDSGPGDSCASPNNTEGLKAIGLIKDSLHSAFKTLEKVPTDE